MKTGDISYRFNPEIENLYIVTKRGKHNGKVVKIYYEYGYMILFDLKNNYVDQYASGFFDNRGVRLFGKIIKPRWDKYKVIDKCVRKGLKEQERC